MTADELRRIAYHRPFRPFRVRLEGGETIEIRRTLRATIGEQMAIFGVDEDPIRKIARRMRVVAPSAIVEAGFITD